jgi:N-acetylmuramoyl-L-alanine amidase
MTHGRTLHGLVTAVSLWLLAWPAPVLARQQDAATLLASARTQATELSRALGLDEPVTPERRRELLRGVDRTLVRLEAVPRRFPRSRQANLALHDAASLADAAFQRFTRDTDRTAALRLYRWLVKEYPGSVHVRHATRRITALSERSRVAQTVGAGAAVAAVDSPSRSTRTPESGGASPGVPAPTMSAALPPRVTPTLASATRARLTSITHQSIRGGERLVLTLDREVAFSEQRISDPDRLYIDLRTVRLDAPVAIPPLPSETAVSEIRTGMPFPDVTRVVLTTKASVTTSLYTLYTPFRIVVEVTASRSLTAVAAETRVSTPSTATAPGVALATPTAPAQALPLPAPAPAAAAAVPATAPRLSAAAAAPAPADSPTAGTSAAAPAGSKAPPAAPAPLLDGYSLSRQLGLGVSHIVIDPGHGGKDPGASGHGVQESLLTLDIALRLERLLKSTPGIDVTLTRRTDEFVALDERTAIANRVHADLFLSIHANASRNPAAHGVETYFLSFAATPDAEAVAARENAASDGAMRQLPDMIRAIALNDKLDESRELAAVVQESLVTRLRRQNKTVRNLGVKKAPFVVLIGARMPSVLAEISFVTNKAEAQRLKSDAYKQRIAEALHAAVMRYRRALKQTAASADVRNDPGR